MEQLTCVTTTAYRPDEAMRGAAEAAARRLGIAYAARGGLSLAEIKEKYGVSLLLIMTRNGWVLHTEGGDLFFHLNMANLRIKNLKAGQCDHMAAALRLQPGMTVLDCTLGLASDAIVASFITGAGGRVCGLEVSPYTAFIVKAGLESFRSGDDAIDAALRRIEVICADYRTHLAALPDKSFDVVYIDPMFRHPIEESVHLKPLRCVADHGALDEAALAEAKRVARRRVVLKENSRGGEFERLAFSKIAGGKYSSVHYGVIELDEEK